jgi:hypothetical protein
MLPSHPPKSAPVAAAADEQSKLSSIHHPGRHYDTKYIQEPGRLSLDDLPAEIVHEIAQHLRSAQVYGFFYHCACDDQEGRAEIGNETLELSTADFDMWSDPSWAFSCASRRYRNIVFRGNRERTCSLGYSRCCIKRALAIPEYLRAAVS